MTIDTNDLLNSILDSLSRIDYIHPGEIPNIDLYMEQVTTFMETQLSSTKRYEQDKILTKTMINNYAKAGILPRPDKKRYGRRHLITLIYIFLLKQVLSIQDIGDFFAIMQDKDHEQLEAFYNIYQELADEYRAEYTRVNCEREERIAQRLKEHGLEGARYEKMMLLSLLSLEATAHKMVCTRLLDASKDPDESPKK